MNSASQQYGFTPTLISLAVLAACLPARAQDAELDRLMRPESSISVGAGYSSGDPLSRTLSGQYNGTRKKDVLGLLDIDINRREDATGTSLILQGRNLGLDSRDLSLSYGRQGSWSLSGGYSELVRHDPRTFNTGMLGVGTATPTVVRLGTPGTGTDFNFQMKRVGLGLAGGIHLTPNLQFEVNFKIEDKKGDRASARGYDCVSYVCRTTQNATNQRWALLMFAEPVDATTRQIEAKLNYAGTRLNLNAGYYGSFYSNAYGSLKATVPNILNNPLGVASTLNPAVAGGTSLQNVLQLPLALSPDNQAHQLYVSGNYRFTPTTRANFKYAIARATQHEDFVSMGLANAPAGVTSLDGALNSQLVQFGLSSRPMPKLSLLADLRYERKEDKTPTALYNVENVTFWRNYRIPTTRVTGKLEASYQLPADMRGTVGLDYKSLDRFVPIRISEDELAGLGAMRAENQERGYRLELRRSMSETLTGSIGYSNSQRRGSNWTSLSTNATFAAAGLGYGETGTASQFIALNPANAFPMNMADVATNKVRLAATWMPTEQLEMQFTHEDSQDRNVTEFSSVAQGKGWRESALKLSSIDASYAISDNWRFTGHATQGLQNLKVNHSSGYQADMNTRTDSVGIGFAGNPTSKMEVGVQLGYTHDRTRYGFNASPSSTGAPPSANNVKQATIGLPDVTYRLNSLNLFAKYELDKNASLQFSFIHQRTKLNEWSWGSNGVPFVFSDGSIVTLNPSQMVNFIGLGYIYRF